jgi:hypothetical protein
LYPADIADVAQRYAVCVHSYADDTQLYVSSSGADSTASVARLLSCIEEIGQWMSANRLKLNADKTQFIWLGSRNQLESTSGISLSVGGVPVTAADTVRNLGVTLDAQLSMKQHVDNVVRSCFYHLRQLRSVRGSVPADAMKTLVHAFISTRIDYCNAILYGVSAAVCRRLQAVLHAAARLITGVKRNEHITPTLRDTLHWLPVPQRITFKIALMAFDCIRGQCPTYFRDICKPVESVVARARLRSADRHDVIVPRTRTIRFGKRSFRVSAPTVWNNLPSKLRGPDTNREQFKSGLKTWLFERAYFQQAPL